MRRSLEFIGLMLFFAVVLALAFIAGYYARAFSDTTPLLRWPLPGIPETDARYPVFTEVENLVSANFNGQLPETKKLEYGMIHGYIGALGDPYSLFVEPQVAEIESNQLAGEYGGIGVEIRRNEAGETLLSPFPESPAEAAGVKTDDVLLKVDSNIVSAETSVDDVTAWLRGPVGSEVMLVVRHADGTEATLAIKRQPIALPSVTWRMIDGQRDIGLITLSRFSDRTITELQRAARELQSQGAAKFVLDLRNNGGGLLDAAVEVSEQFLQGGVVMYESSRDGPEKNYSIGEGGVLTQVPLTVLINGNTASAAEILAGALLDRGRAPLIGQKTFGKASVQFIFPLSDGSSLHITAKRWFTPTRRELDKIGLPPTIEVQPASDGSDAELNRAVDYLNNGQ
ncbi:MAG: S41 family peptidase [Anaerolineales bacterium]